MNAICSFREEYRFLSNFYQCPFEYNGLVYPIVVAECRKRLTPKNIRKIAREIMRIAQSMEDLSELKRLEALLKSTEQAKENQMSALRQCQDATVRNMIFQDLAAIGAEIDELHRSIDAEKMRRYSVSEEQAVDYLNRIASGDANNPAYRKALIKMFVNKIYLYDMMIKLQSPGSAAPEGKRGARRRSGGFRPWRRRLSRGWYFCKINTS